MVKGLIGWLRRQTDLIFGRKKPRDPRFPAPKVATTSNKSYITDPSVPSLVSTDNIPATTRWPMRSKGEAGGGYAIGSPQQQAGALKQIVNEHLVFMIGRSKRKPTKWARTALLNLDARAGVDANAYYNGNALKFFYFQDKTRRTVFACDSRHVVTHEFGHAFLDALRPDMWSAQALEVWAFHEAFGDICSLIAVTNKSASLAMALEQTGGDLSKSNVVSKVAAQMGAALNQIYPGSAEPNGCIRDMATRYDWSNPEDLPSDGEVTDLTSEPHSFSRVFSSMFYRLVIAASQEVMKTTPNQLQAWILARNDMLDRFLEATAVAPLNVRLYRSVCQEMLLSDTRRGGKYQSIMSGVFADSKILVPGVKAMEEVTVDDIAGRYGEAAIVDKANGFTAVRTAGVLSAKIPAGTISALSANPLLGLEVELAHQSAHYFDQEGRLYSMMESDLQQAYDSARKCLDYINQKGMASGDDKAIFKIDGGKLVRNQIACCFGFDRLGTVKN